jgi:hypothetical protein
LLIVHGDPWAAFLAGRGRIRLRFSDHCWFLLKSRLLLFVLSARIRSDVIENLCNGQGASRCDG